MHSDIKQIAAAERHLKESRKELANNGGDPMKKSSKMIIKSFEESIGLLLSSIKYQDPLKPADSSKLSKQMFLLSQTQGQNAMLDKIEEQNQLAKTAQVLNSSGLIGKSIEVRSDKFTLNNRENVEIGAILPADVHGARFAVVDEKGGVVYEKEIKPNPGQTTFTPGKHEFVWNGEVNTAHGKAIKAGDPLENGEYRIRVIAYDAKGAGIKEKGEDSFIEIPTTVKAKLTGSDFSDNTPKIVMGSHKLPMSSIVSIQEHKAPKEEAAAAINRFESVRATLAVLPEEEQDAIWGAVREHAENHKKRQKLEKEVNVLTPKEYELLTKEIEQRINKL